MGKAAKPKQQLENRVRRETSVTAYEETCTSPRGVRKFTHRTDVLNNPAAAQARSKAFVDKYQKQGWGVTVRALMG